MKALALITMLVALQCAALAQEPSDSTTTYRFILTDGGEIIGQILNQDEREVFVLTADDRKIYIPQYTIKKIIPLRKSDFNQEGDYIGEDKFATRYFLTTNGLPMKKGEHYVQWNIYGPDFQFSLTENLSAGVMTSWIGVPIIGNVKYSMELSENTQLAVGMMAGTGSWTLPDFGGVLPFATLSFGNRSRNLAISGGYGAVWTEGEADGRALMSVAGMIKVSPTLSLVFDSFMLLPGQRTVEQEHYDPTSGETTTYTAKQDARFVGIFVPGLRWHQNENQAFQFGFSGIAVEGDLLPLPIPMVQWYRAF